jgi:exosortase D (VPLPA-CTERM-specific)
VVLYALLLTGLYYAALAFMIQSWERPEYNYCYLIPLVVLYLLWEKRKVIGALPSSPSWWGIAPVVFGLLLFWLGELAGEYFTLYVSLWVVLIGLCWLHLGFPKLKAISFPLFMLLAMFPLPAFLYGRISVKLQLISSKIGVMLLQLYGMSAYREGNVIDLGFTKLQVVEACSGLRSLISLIVLAFLLAYFFKAAFWKRAILVISTIPIAVFMNSGRIALTGILHELWGAEVAIGFFHGFSGWIIFMVAFGLLLLEMGVLKRQRA